MFSGKDFANAIDRFGLQSLAYFIEKDKLGLRKKRPPDLHHCLFAATKCSRPLSQTPSDKGEHGNDPVTADEILPVTQCKAPQSEIFIYRKLRKKSPLLRGI